MEKGMDRAADFITALEWDQLPGAVRRRVKMCLMDNLAVTLAGTLTPVSSIAAGYAAQTWGGDEASIIRRKKRASAPGAAFANACAANGLDLDDDAIFTRSPLLRISEHIKMEVFLCLLISRQCPGSDCSVLNSVSWFTMPRWMF